MKPPYFRWQERSELIAAHISGVIERERCILEWLMVVRSLQLPSRAWVGGPTFSWISCVDWASQKATVAKSFRMGISTVQSRPSRSATRGRGCMGPFMIWGLIPGSRWKRKGWNPSLFKASFHDTFISSKMQFRHLLWCWIHQEAKEQIDLKVFLRFL